MILSRTENGLVRRINQDAVFASPTLCAVADGMGGHKAGEVASQIAIEQIRTHQEKSPDKQEAQLIFDAINHAIYSTQKDNEEYGGMGTTLTAAWLCKKRLIIAHVGDSRLYVINQKGICQLTQDHSYVGRLVRDRLITEEQARTNPYRNYIDRALGLEETVEIQFIEYSLQKGDIILICSDGLSSMIPKEELRQVIWSSQGDLTLDILFQKAIAAGAPDNISAILIWNDEVKP